MTRKEDDKSKSRKFMGVILLVLGVFLFFMTIPAVMMFATSDAGPGVFIAVFFLGFLGSSALIFIGIWLMGDLSGKLVGTTMPRTMAPFSFPPGPKQQQGPNQHHQQISSQDQQQPHSYVHTPPEQVPVVIQHIGEYVAGSKVEIRDSIIQRSSIGDTSGGDVSLPGDRASLLEEYRNILRTVWADGKLSPTELRFIEELREQKSISPEEHRVLEAEVLEEKGLD